MATRQLDRSRPYGEVWGNGCEALEQDGVLYNLAGQPLGGEPDPAEPVPAPAARAKKTAAAAPAEPVPDFADKSDDELRMLVEISGGAWTERAAAVAMLTGA